MPVSRKRSSKSKTKGGLARVARRKAALYLPLDKASADQISLRFHAALEVARRGAADASTALVLAHATLLVDLIRNAGYGQIDEDLLESLRDDLATLFGKAHESGDWSFSEQMLAKTTAVVNEHDRQLRELSMAIIVEATEDLERKLSKASSMENALRNGDRQ